MRVTSSSSPSRAPATDAVGPHEVFAGAGQAAAALGRTGGYRVTLASRGGGTVLSESGLVLGTSPLPAPLNASTPWCCRGDGGRRGRRTRPAGLHPATRTALPSGGDGVLGSVPRCCGGVAAGPPGHDPLGSRPPARRRLPHAHRRFRSDLHPRRENWSSAGVAAGIDLALALVQEDLGVDVAQTIARWLVMFLHRPGGQTQFASPVWVPRAEHSTIRAVQTLVEAAPGGDHRLPTLAAAAAMSVRHFTRVFSAEVGETPSRFVERTRLEAARRGSKKAVTRSTSWRLAAASGVPRHCAGFSSDTSVCRRTVPAALRSTPHERTSA